MVTVEHDRSAALLIRVWAEGSPEEFRARLSTVDTSRSDGAEQATVAVASSPEAVLETVRGWLSEFTGAAGTD
jgi:hypothetical protein